MNFLSLNKTKISLKPSFMLITAFLFIVSAIAVTCSVRSLAETIIEHWAPRYMAKQALYDKSRTLQPIVREVALSRQLASSRFLREWAKDPENPQLKASALAELENFRTNFQDKSYFVGILKNGSYYHNNAANEFAGHELRYVLDPHKKSDSWFYDLIRQNRDMHINVNPDVELGITKLWIDVLIRDGDDILGIAGTGLDLTRFLNSVVDEVDPGIMNLFVDHGGAIQLHRNVAYIDFGSVSKAKGTHKTIDLIFDRPGDLETIYSTMAELKAGKSGVATTFVNVHGKRQLAGIVYLPEIDWHEITLIDIGTVLPLSQFSTILVVYIISLLFILIIFNFALSTFVLTPLNQLDRAMGRMEHGNDPSSHLSIQGLGEMGRLIDRFLEMARVVLTSKLDLERQVRDRTADLERLAQIDPLTELLNRRGMTERLNNAMVRAEREGNPLGILWLDVDWFKEINDTLGHPEGDRALKAVAGIIQQVVRPYDVAARWGGDEFLVMLQPADFECLDAIGERLRRSVAACRDAKLKMSVSVGGSLSQKKQDLTGLLHHADLALYQAKEDGRNCYRRFRPKFADSDEN